MLGVFKTIWESNQTSIVDIIGQLFRACLINMACFPDRSRTFLSSQPLTWLTVN